MMAIRFDASVVCLFACLLICLFCCFCCWFDRSLASEYLRSCLFVCLFVRLCVCVSKQTGLSPVHVCLLLACLVVCLLACSCVCFARWFLILRLFVAGWFVCSLAFSVCASHLAVSLVSIIN